MYIASIISQRTRSAGVSHDSSIRRLASASWTAISASRSVPGVWPSSAADEAGLTAGSSPTPPASTAARSALNDDPTAGVFCIASYSRRPCQPHGLRIAPSWAA